MGGQLVADGQAFLVFAELCESGRVGQLLFARLDREISLAVGDDGLARITVLDDQVAGVAGQPDVLDLPLRAGADVDHCEDILNMVLYRLAAIAAGFLGPFDDGQEMAVLRIVQHACQLPCQPELVALVIDVADALETGMVLTRDGFFRHFGHPLRNGLDRMTS